MSGAEEALKISLKYDKMNIDARNLLGLVYYETGEVVLALSHWVISVNYFSGLVLSILITRFNAFLALSYLLSSIRRSAINKYPFTNFGLSDKTFLSWIFVDGTSSDR